ncbi:ComE operon protein 3 [subsurface metagenome]
MRGGFVILGVLFGLNVLAWVAVYDLSQSQLLEIVFFDVGQGDAIFIETPQGHQILIDGGPDSTVLERLGDEVPFWDRTIDLIILTHPEQDHVSGLIDVLKRYKVENILWTGVLKDTSEYRQWQELIRDEGAQITIARAGQQIQGSKSNPKHWSIEILFPFESFEGKEVKNANNTSIVARLVYGANSFLFTGDAYKSIEKQLLAMAIDADVLKVGHHGSKTSSAQEFIEKVSPDIAVIQVGEDNSYGHPHPETLEILEKYGINILRTDLNGDIKILCNSQSLKLKLRE